MMTLINFSKASFRGVPFHLATAVEKKEWRHASYEFISNHPPEVKRYAQAPLEIQIDGYLAGKDAIFMKDLLSKACDKAEPGKLVHPLYGYKDAICIASEFSSLGDSFNAFSFSLSFKEVLVPAKNDWLAKAISRVDELNSTILDAALSFTETIAAPISASVYAFDRACKSVLAINNALHSLAGVTMFEEIKSFLDIDGNTASPATLSDILVHEVKLTSKLIARLQNAAKALSLVPEASCISTLEKVLDTHKKSTDEPINDSENNAADQIRSALVFFAIAEKAKDNAVTTAFLPLITQTLELVANDTAFLFLWDLQKQLQSAPKVQIKSATSGQEPSLVRAYLNHQNLEQAEELAYAAGQPFRL